MTMRRSTLQIRTEQKLARTRVFGRVYLEEDRGSMKCWRGFGTRLILYSFVSTFAVHPGPMINTGEAAALFLISQALLPDYDYIAASQFIERNLPSSITFHPLLSVPTALHSARLTCGPATSFSWISHCLWRQLLVSPSEPMASSIHFSHVYQHQGTRNDLSISFLCFWEMGTHHWHILRLSLAVFFIGLALFQSFSTILWPLSLWLLPQSHLVYILGVSFLPAI